METAIVALTEAQRRVLSTMIVHARCVGATRTDETTGFVNTAAAQALVAAGLAHHETSATGRNVYVLTVEGWNAAWADPT